VPPGAPADAYGRLTTIAHTAGARSIVDAAGETLLRALDAAPDLVTPNLAEAEGALGLGTGGDAPPRALAAADALLRQGARTAVVTAGAAGAAVAADGVAEWITAPRVAEVRNPIGAGDAFLAALAGTWERGDELAAAARAGVAAGAASVESPTAGELDPERARALAAVMARGV
jgi:fructose-1-phosphate kinase PfkB-like protein